MEQNKRKLIFYFENNQKPIVLTDETKNNVKDEADKLVKLLTQDNVVCEIYTPFDCLIVRSKDIKSILISDLNGNKIDCDFPKDRIVDIKPQPKEKSKTEDIDVKTIQPQTKSKKTQKLIITSSKK